MADLMVISADGSVRTSGWTHHGQETAEPGFERVSPSVSASRQDVLAAIRATSDRHAANRSLRSVGLSPADWHDLFQALIEAESSYNSTAIRPKGPMVLVS